MAKPRKDVKFQHRGTNQNTKARRPSMTMSEHSEGGRDEPTSPTNGNAVGKPDESVSPFSHHTMHPSSHHPADHDPV